MDLRPALEAVIRELRAKEPFLPVAVVVPNHLLGVWLSRSIFRDTGHMAIEFVLAHELAWKIAAPSLLREGRVRLPENVGLAVLLGAVPDAVADASTADYLREATAERKLRVDDPIGAALLFMSIVKAPFHLHQLCGLIETPPPAAIDRAVKEGVDIFLRAYGTLARGART